MLFHFLVLIIGKDLNNKSISFQNESKFGSTAFKIFTNFIRIMLLVMI